MGATVASVRDRAFLDLKPELTTARRHASDDAAWRRRANRASLGLEINARPRADWVFNATFNPDYSQVEIDEPTSSGASRIALSLPEKRGFFLESADVLGLPLAAFYSRTVADPDWGMRATWRAAQLDATAMSLRDHERRRGAARRPVCNGEFAQTHVHAASLVRGRWHGEAALLLGAFASRRDYGRAGANTVVGFDGQWRGDGQQAAWLLMQSNSNAPSPTTAPALRVAARRGGYWLGQTHADRDVWWNEAEVRSDQRRLHQRQWLRAANGRAQVGHEPQPPPGRAPAGLERPAGTVRNRSPPGPA